MKYLLPVLYESGFVGSKYGQETEYIFDLSVEHSLLPSMSFLVKHYGLRYL